MRWKTVKAIMGGVKQMRVGEYYTVREFAKLCGISHRTAYRHWELAKEDGFGLLCKGIKMYKKGWVETYGN